MPPFMTLEPFPVPLRQRETQRVPPFMTSRNVEGIRVCFDHDATLEFEKFKTEYTEVFRHTRQAIGHLLQKYGQVPIWLFGKNSPHVQYGIQKIIDDGCEPEDPEEGIAFYGSFRFEFDGKEHRQECSVFIVNLERAILGEYINDDRGDFWCGHATVFVHELSHSICDQIDGEKFTEVEKAYQKTVARRDDVLRKFTVNNRRQFDGHHWVNADEFLAYTMEALHSRSNW